MGEVDAGDVGDPGDALFGAAVFAVGGKAGVGAGETGDDGDKQGGLVGFDDQQVVGAVVFDQSAGGVALGVRGILAR